MTRSHTDPGARVIAYAGFAPPRCTRTYYPKAVWAVLTVIALWPAYVLRDRAPFWAVEGTALWVVVWSLALTFAVAGTWAHGAGTLTLAPGLMGAGVALGYPIVRGLDLVSRSRRPGHDVGDVMDSLKDWFERRCTPIDWKD